MATVTPNFNWPVPTSTDLVKDGAVAIEALGDSIDASLVDLKGGTSGQVLAKASNTDMDFAWVAQDDSNAIQNSIVDAKGDLIAATANDTPARLAVGANGETLVADSSTSTGLRYQGTQNAGKNAIINGGMDIWQRGTSFAGTTLGAYSADRWGFYRGGAVGEATWTRQTSGLDNIQFSMRIQRNSGTTSTQYMAIWSALENSDSLRFAGKTVTLSFWAKAGANYSATGGLMNAILLTGTGTNEAPFSFTGGVAAINANPALTTSWQRFSYTATLATSMRQIAVQLLGYPTGTAGANDWLEVTGIQLELGSVATEFLRNGSTIQGELAACQRYYYRNAPGTAYGFQGTMAYGQTTTIADAQVVLPVTMRTVAAAIETLNIAINDATNYYSGGTYVIQASGTTANTTNIRYTHGSAVFTSGKVYQFTNNNNTSGYLGISAEL